MNNTQKLYSESPKGKEWVFKEPNLLMLSGGQEIARWNDTQPLYFYPHTWLDYLNAKGVVELHICSDCSVSLAERAISQLQHGKVHIEQMNLPLIEQAQHQGLKVSILCDFDAVTEDAIPVLSRADIVRFRLAKGGKLRRWITRLAGLPLLSCVRAYVGEIGDYRRLVDEVRETGVDLLHITKRLVTGTENPGLSRQERAEILSIKAMETEALRIVIPTSLDTRFAARFTISPEYGNTTYCGIPAYRLVLSREAFYPCYTRSILSGSGSGGASVAPGKRDCGDCACIYENDMLASISSTRTTAGSNQTRFVLQYPYSK